MTNKKIWAATLFSTLLLTMTISSPVKAAELQTSTTVDRSQITLPLSEETEENLAWLFSRAAQVTHLFQVIVFLIIMNMAIDDFGEF